MFNLCWGKWGCSGRVGGLLLRVSPPSRHANIAPLSLVPASWGVRYTWPANTLSNVKRERKPTRCNNQMFIINICLNMFRASLCPSSGEQRPCVTACGVLRWFCWMWLAAVVGRCVVGCEHCEGYCSTSHCSHPTTQRPTTAANHIQQNQRSTPHAVTHGLCSPEDGHNDARNMLRRKLIIDIWLLHLVGFLSLHTLLTMHGHRNLKHYQIFSFQIQERVV